MQSISISAQEAHWKELIQQVPELKRAVFEDIGPKTLSDRL